MVSGWNIWMLAAGGEIVEDRIVWHKIDVGRLVEVWKISGVMVRSKKFGENLWRKQMFAKVRLTFEHFSLLKMLQ